MYIQKINKGDSLMKKLAGTILTASIVLAGCGFGNNDKGSSKVSDDSTSKSHQSSDNKGDQSSQSNQSSSQSSSKSSKTQQENTNTQDYYAKVWLTVFKDYRGSGEVENHISNMSHTDVSGEAINPYNKEASEKYPDGVQIINGTPTAAGHVIYINNGDGTITTYGTPSHFQDRRWMEDDYTKSETKRILDNANTIKLYDASQDEIDKVKGYFNESDTVAATDDDVSSDSSDDSDDDTSSDSSDTTVTRDNVIDKVEDYEGHQLDTSTYTYKEPEKNSDGEWGFSFTDKDGNLAGSYIIDEDGNVTKYDENGDEE